jgi:hypothetical protein
VAMEPLVTFLVYFLFSPKYFKNMVAVQLFLFKFPFDASKYLARYMKPCVGNIS